jgi:DNA polymerase elongation subunit (family B)
VFPSCDITGAIEAMLQYLYDQRNVYKALMVDAEIMGKLKEATKWDRKQLPIKIFNNSAFGSISAPHIFNWGDIDIGEMITCTGRQYLRHMIGFFKERGYDPLVLDTDGVNFSYKDDINNNVYIGKGIHRFVEKDKEYVGINADVAEYNERFMHGVMGLDIDYMMAATINLSRKNYANLDGKGKIKLTGNSIKSKSTPIYIEKFLNKGIKMLLEGNGKEFVSYYHEYVEKIFNQNIPLADIANKSKVKKTLRQYKNRGTNKNGGPLPRQAHMELIMKDNIHADLGDTIYYINNGTKKSHGDIQVKKNKANPEGLLVFNSYIISEEDMKNNPDLTGEYNVAKYIEAFNKKVTPLMVVFQQSVRDSLILTDPEDKQFYTNSELELINGVPLDETGQDSLEELMTISDEENRFWSTCDKPNDYMIVDLLEQGELKEPPLELPKPQINTDEDVEYF